MVGFFLISFGLVFLCLWVSVFETLCLLVGFLLVVDYFLVVFVSILLLFLFSLNLSCYFVWTIGFFVCFQLLVFLAAFWGRVLFMILFCFLFFIF